MINCKGLRVTEQDRQDELKKKNIKLALILVFVAFVIYAGFIFQHL